MKTQTKKPTWEVQQSQEGIKAEAEYKDGKISQDVNEFWNSPEGKEKGEDLLSDIRKSMDEKTSQKLYKVSLTRYPEEFEFFASSEEEAKRKAKDQINWSVWESEVEEVE